MAGESDREQIVDLMAQFAHATDDGTKEEYTALLTEDACMTLANGEVSKGRDAFVAGAMGRRAGGRLGPGSHTKHIVSTISVKVTGDSATARSYVVTMTDEGGDKVAAKKLLMYNDRFRRVGDVWRMAERVVSNV